MVPATSRITSVATPASASYVTGTSTTARDHCCDLLPTRRMVPFGTCHTTPSTSRSRVVRRLTPSTVPVATPVSMTSPTPNWSSISMNMPERKSRTRDCAPNPSAIPAMPAPAIRGARLIPSVSSTDSTAIDQITMVMRLRTTAPIVSARWVRRACDIGPVSTSATPPRIEASLSTPPLRWRTKRAVKTRVIRTRIHATNRMTRMRIGFASESATSAALASPVIR